MNKRKIAFTFNSPVVLSFVIISFIVLLLGSATDGATTTKYFCTYRASLLNPLMYLRLFTHVLGHSNLAHYAGNMLYILLLGPMLEEKYGSKNLLIMIIITALVTGLVNNIFFTTGLLGASGIVFMMIVLSSMVSFKQGEIPITMILVIVLYLGNEVIEGVFTTDNISQLTHVLGGVCGLVFGFAYKGNKGKR